MSVLPDFSPAQHDDLSPEVDLLGDDPACSDDEDDRALDAHDHSLVTAPILTGDVLGALGTGIFPETALYGRVLSQRGEGLPRKSADGRVFINTNAPFSAVVCGAQGSGKSQTTSVLLESVLIQNGRLGALPEPLSALVFHFETAVGGGRVLPCEAAFLSSIDPVYGGHANAPPVIVLVLPDNLPTMRRVYAGLPNVRVVPLHFSPQDLTEERLLTMFKADENTQFPPYIEGTMSILRGMEGAFDCGLFRERLQDQIFSPGQKDMLSLRLSLLESCLQGGTSENSVVSHFRQGQLTIVDLSSPFMNGSSACGVFDAILGLFVDVDMISTSKARVGKLVVLDEAHKYLSDPESSENLRESLLRVIRQQRRRATRVVISTQEPTIVPGKILDLCSFIIAHRFSSPKWLKHLFEHVSAGSSDELWKKIISLGVGQGILFSPSGLTMRAGFKTESSASAPRLVAPLGQGYLVVRSRLRVTSDGGHSILAVQDTYMNPRVAGNDSGEGTVPGAPPTPDSAQDFIRETTPAGSQLLALDSSVVVPLTPTSVDPVRHELEPSGPRTRSSYDYTKQDATDRSGSPMDPEHPAASSDHRDSGSPEAETTNPPAQQQHWRDLDKDDCIPATSACPGEDHVDRLVAFLYSQQDVGRIFVSLTSVQYHFALTESEILPIAQAAARREAVVLFGRADGSVALCLPESVSEAATHAARWAAGHYASDTYMPDSCSTSTPPADPSTSCTSEGTPSLASDHAVSSKTAAGEKEEDTEERKDGPGSSSLPIVDEGREAVVPTPGIDPTPSLPSVSLQGASSIEVSSDTEFVLSRLLHFLHEQRKAGMTLVSLKIARQLFNITKAKFLPIAQEAAHRGLLVLHEREDGSFALSLPADVTAPPPKADSPAVAPSQGELPHPSHTTSTANITISLPIGGRLGQIQRRLIKVLTEERAAGTEWISMKKARMDTMSCISSGKFLPIAQDAAARGLVLVRQAANGSYSFALGPRALGEGDDASGTSEPPTDSHEPAVPSRSETPETSLADLIPLLDFMRQGQGHITRQNIRQYFQDTVGKPDAETDSLVSMACKEELLVGGGEGHNAWARLPEHQAVDGCDLCTQGRG